MYSTDPAHHVRPFIGTWTELALGGILYKGCTVSVEVSVAEAIFAIMKDPRFKLDDLDTLASGIRLVKKQMEADCPALRCV